MTVAVVFERIGPYHHARLKAVAEFSCDAVTAVELFAMEDAYPWTPLGDSLEYPRVTVHSESRPTTTPTDVVWRNVHATLDRVAPDVVAVPGWAGAGPLAAVAWTRSTMVPSILMSDSTESARTRWPLKEAVKRRIVSCFDAALVAGERSGAYAMKLGISQNRIFYGYDVVDNEHFREGAADVRARQAEVRRALRLPAHYFLCVARMIPQKNLPTLLSAYARYLRASGDEAWALVLVGDGPEQPGVEERIRSLGIGDHVRLSGSRQYEELPAFYALAHALILPSVSETWGLVINEALACGLPVIASSQCGCVPDLVEHLVTGLVFDPENEEGLSESLSRLSTDDQLRTRLSEAGNGRVNESYGIERFAQGLAAAADAARAASTNSRRRTMATSLLLRAASRLGG